MFTRACLFAILASSTACRTAPTRPNFIVIMADDCSAREIGCYGNIEHKTPHLDKMAATGVMFRTCWATPICSSSRAEIMTGRYAYRTRWYHNTMKPRPADPGGNLSKSNLIFAQLLKSVGYATAIVGKWQLHGTQKEYGFDESCMWEFQPKSTFDGPVEGKNASLPGRAARYWHPSIVRNGKQLRTKPDDYGPDIFTDFINDFARRHKDSPFLIYYPMALTHKSWDFDLKKNTWIPTPELDANGQKTGRKTKDTLKSNVEYMDHVIGRIVRNLDELGIRQNTVVMFTTDNGTSGDGKGNVSQERGSRVPMIVNGPSLIKPLGPVEALMDFSDMLPTLADLAGIALPDNYEINGRSVAPVLRGRKEHVRDWIFCPFADKRMIRDQRWLLDGDGRLWDCGQRRDEQGYKDVTDANDPDVQAARQRFASILETLPAPDPDDPLLKKWNERKAKHKRNKARAKKMRAIDRKRASGSQPHAQ